MRPFRTLIYLSLLFPTAAQAFCGTFVGDSSDTLSNTSSEVILARDGDQTVLTVIMNYEGTADNFAILLPIPEVVTAKDVGSIKRELVDWLGAFSVPREIAYTCGDVFATQEKVFTGCALGFGCDEYALATDGTTDKFWDTGGLDSGVTVESAFVENGYDFVVLSAEESGALFTWLTNNGYAIPSGGEAILQEYIDAGVYFLAAKVSTSKVEIIDGWLPPIQLHFASDFFGLPIRIGTISASGPQDVVILALTPVEDGEVSITNYPEWSMGNECTWKGDDFSGWYDAQVQKVWEENGAGWVKEYSWDLKPTVGQGYHCDPCTADPAAPTSDGSFRDFGLASRSAHITRLHARYSPEQATQDLSLVVSGISGVNDQLKFIDPLPEIEFLFPDCDDGFAENPGTCPDVPAENTGAVLALGLGAGLSLFVLRRRAHR